MSYSHECKRCRSRIASIPHWFEGTLPTAPGYPEKFESADALIEAANKNEITRGTARYNSQIAGGKTEGHLELGLDLLQNSTPESLSLLVFQEISESIPGFNHDDACKNVDRLF